MSGTLFLVVAAYGLYFFLVRRRPFDFVSAAFIGELIYFMPGFYGYVANPYFTYIDPSVPIASGAYFIWTFAMFATILTGKLYRPEPQAEWPPLRTSDAFDIVLIFVIVFSFATELVLGGGVILSSDKFEVLEGANRFFLLFAAATQLGLIAFILQGKWIKATVPVGAVLFLLYAGFRSDVALAMIAIATFMARTRGIWIFTRPRYLVPLLSVVLVLFTYKGFLVSYRAGRWDLFYQLMANEEYFTEAYLHSEPFITQAILNEVLIRDLTMPASNILLSMVAAIPFFVPLVGLENMDVAFAFQEQLFPNLTYGVASNIYANFYATLGIFGIFLFVVLHCLALVGVSKAMSASRSSALRLGLLAVGAFLAFYIHRNDLANTLSSMNRIFITLIVIWVLGRYIEWPLRRQGVAAAPRPLAGK